MQPPKYYIKTYYEPRQGFQFEQPVQRLNGKSYYEYSENSYERENWGFFLKESYQYNSALDYSQFNSSLWLNETIKIDAFNKIYDFINKGKSGNGSSITALFPFEIFLLNDGFKMVNFCELNAINPGVSIVAEKQNGDEIINPKGIKYTRSYLKNDNFIYLAFGIEFNKKKTNFYFQTSKSNHFFQVDNSIENYSNAINGKLPILDIRSDNIA
jgi:hypothetical protein